MPHIAVGHGDLLVEEPVGRLQLLSSSVEPTTATMWLPEPSRQSSVAPGPWCRLTVSTSAWSLKSLMPSMAVTVAETVGGWRKNR